MKPFNIRGLSVNQIGPFSSAEFSFKEKTDNTSAEIHILTGENGTGKSTILQMLANCVPNKSSVLGKKIRKGLASSYQILFSDESIVNYPEDLILVDDNPFLTAFKKGLGTHVYDTLPEPLKKWGYEEDSLTLDTAFFAYSGYRKLSDSTIDSIAEPKTNAFENALNFDKSTDTKTFVNWLAITITKNALAYSKRNLEDRERAFEYHKPIAEIEKAISSITDWRIEFELQENPLAIIINVNDQPLEFDQLPDGLKSIISWLGDLIMRLDRLKWHNSVPLTERRFILFLDEIEIHLHPSWQRKILPIVQKLFPNAQVFISTHSPFVVGSVDGAWVYRFTKAKDDSASIPIEPSLSEDSFSYEYILAEVFGISERFGVGVEKDLTEFKMFRNQIIHGIDHYDHEKFNQLVNRLMNQSSEIQSIIGMELRQLSRLTNQTFF